MAIQHSHANVTIDDGSGVQTERTDSDGRVSYTADGSPTDVRMWINDDGPDWEAVVFEDFGVAASGNATGIDRIYDVTWDGEGIATQDGVRYSAEQNRLSINDDITEITVSGTVTEDGNPVHGATVDFATTNSDAAGFDLETRNETINGEFETTLTVGALGDGTLYAASGDDVDSIGFEVVEPEEAPTVETRDATGVSQTEATLNGDLTNLGTANEVDVRFQYRETGAATWIDTPTQTRTTTGTFDETITNLDSDTEYEFRAVAESTDGSDTGEPLTFTTDTEQGEPPVFNTLTASSTNNVVTFSWEVSGDFDLVTLTTQSASTTSTDRSGSVTLSKQGGNRAISATVEGPDGSETCDAIIGNNEDLTKDDFTCTTTG